MIRIIPLGNKRLFHPEIKRLIISCLERCTPIDIYYVFFFCRIFQKCPDIKALWQNSRLTTNAATTAGDDADAPNTANRWKIDLRNHGSKFFNSLDDLISVVDKPEELFKMLHEIGVKHKNYEVKVEHIQVCIYIFLFFVIY